MWRSLRYLVLAGSTLVACSTQGPAPGELADIPEGYGALQLALQYKDAPATPMTATLTIVDTADPANVVTRTYDGIENDVVLDLVPLPPGTYDLSMKVVNSLDESVYYGSQNGVSIIAGQTTAITLYLQPSGNLGVVAKMTSYGHVFTCAEPLAVDQTEFDSIMGAQRIETVDLGGDPVPETVYYLWAHGNVDTSSSWYMYTSTDPASWDLFDSDGQPKGTPVTMKWTGFSSVTVAGDTFVMFDDYSRKFSQSKDGVTWVELSELPTNLASMEYSTEYGMTHYANDAIINYCSLIVDNQYNLFCPIRYNYCQSTDTPCPWDSAMEQSGLVSSWSPDGVTWEMIEHDVAQPVTFDAGFYGDSVDSIVNPNEWRFTLKHGRLDGSVYRLWYMALERDIHTPYVNGLHPRLMESVDREHWSDAAVYFPTEGENCPDIDLESQLSLQINLIDPKWAVFVEPASGSEGPVMHVYTIPPGLGSFDHASISHYRSVE